MFWKLNFYIFDKKLVSINNKRWPSLRELLRKELQIVWFVNTFNKAQMAL